MKTSTHCTTCFSRDKSVFCELEESHLRDFDLTKTVNRYKPRQVIFYEGNQPYGLYCIKTGKVKIYKTDAEGHYQILRIAGPGDIVGYSALFSAQPYTVTAEALEETNVCFIDKKNFFQILESHPRTAFRVMTTLAQDLGRAECQVSSMVHRSIRERMAELLLFFKTKYGEKNHQGIRLNISLTREEFAEMIGCTQESVIRLLSDFKEERMIVVRGREITLCDLPALMDAANLAI